jgi:hypothetical protein
MLVSQFLDPEELVALTERQREVLFTYVATSLVSSPEVRKALEPKVTAATKSLLKSGGAEAGERAATTRKKKA